jgi:hypothetical protein
VIRLRQFVTEFTAPIVGDPDGRCQADALLVGGDFTPGVCVVSKAGIPYTWDKQKGWGYSGAWLLFTGDDLSEFDTTITVWRQDQVDAWKAWSKKYLAKAPVQAQQNSAFLASVPRPKALGVYNPILAELGITAIVPKHIGQWNQVSIGKWTRTISWFQWRAPKPALGKPKEAIGAPKKKDPTADDATMLEIRSKRQTIAAKQAALAKGHH